MLRFLYKHCLAATNCVQQSRCDTGQCYQCTTRGKIPMARGIHCSPKSCLFLLPHHRLYTVHNMCTHTHRLYMNYRETFLHRSERCKVLTGYLSLGRRSGGDWTNSGHWAERFTVCFWTGSGSSQLLPCFATYRFSWGALYYRHNTVIVLWTDYTIITVTCITDNYGRLQYLILPFKLPMVTRKNSS